MLCACMCDIDVVVITDFYVFICLSNKVNFLLPHCGAQGFHEATPEDPLYLVTDLRFKACIMYLNKGIQAKLSLKSERAAQK